MFWYVQALCLFHTLSFTSLSPDSTVGQINCLRCLEDERRSDDGDEDDNEEDDKDENGDNDERSCTNRKRFADTYCSGVTLFGVACKHTALKRYSRAVKPVLAQYPMCIFVTLINLDFLPR